jgi:predicted DCC family thiol-disulfide oxidoreductase YuxK
MIRVLRSFGGAWSALAALIWLAPRPLRDVAYRFIAKRRYRWFGQRETCYLPEPSEASRFLQN